MVTYRSRYLVFTPFSERYRDTCQLLTRYDVILENGFLKEYHCLKEDEPGGNVWHMRLAAAHHSNFDICNAMYMGAHFLPYH